MILRRPALGKREVSVRNCFDLRAVERVLMSGMYVGVKMAKKIKFNAVFWGAKSYV